MSHPSGASPRADGSAFSAVPADIASGARRLREVTARSAAARTFTDAGDVGEYDDVSTAVSTMVSDWSAALDRWQVSMTALSDAAAGAGASISRVDAETAATWTSPRFVARGGPR